MIKFDNHIIKQTNTGTISSSLYSVLYAVGYSKIYFCYIIKYTNIKKLYLSWLI